MRKRLVWFVLGNLIAAVLGFTLAVWINPSILTAPTGEAK